LSFAYLSDAYLSDAYLSDARYLPASLKDHKDPETPYSRKERDPAERAVEYRVRNPHVPVVVDLDRKILDAIEHGGSLKMDAWHGTCNTTHCRAGWAIHLAGEAGYALEGQIGSHRAGRAIYLASTGRAPHFFATDERALADIRRCAAGEK
jgi:hypothetical protein